MDLLSVLRFIPIGVFDDATVRIIGRAFDAACKELKDTGQPDVVHEVMIKRIIAAARKGERNGARWVRADSPKKAEKRNSWIKGEGPLYGDPALSRPPHAFTRHSGLGSGQGGLMPLSHHTYNPFCGHRRT